MARLHVLVGAPTYSFDAPGGRVTLHRGEPLEPLLAYSDLSAADRKLFKVQPPEAPAEPPSTEA